jgi:6-phosphogluconolactonase
MNLSKRIFLDVDLLEANLVERISKSLINDIDQNGKAYLLLSGGSTPLHLYKLLSNVDLSWGKVFVGLVDERYVSNEDSFSNERMVKQALLQNFAISANFIGLVYDSNNIKLNLIESLQRNKLFFDGATCVLLGMGSDGHTASLFPDDINSIQALKTAVKSSLVNTKAPSVPIDRITFNKETIMKSKTILLYFRGDEKMEVFSKAKLNKDSDKYPVSSFIHKNQRLIEVFWTF